MLMCREPRHVGRCCRPSRLASVGQGKCDRIVGLTGTEAGLHWHLRNVRRRFLKLLKEIVS